MEIKLLGPLELTMEGQVITPSAAKPRQVLALLAMNAGRVTPVSALVEELWGDKPVRSAQTTLQTYVMQLRKSFLGAGGDRRAKEILCTHYGGYLLNVEVGCVDVHRYQQLVDSGNCAIERGEYAAGSSMLRSALDLWRGPALVDVQHGSRLGIQLAWLEESRLTTVENRIEAELRLGRHHSMLSELAMLTTQHPMHENLCGLYMVALHRDGRRWQALQAYRNLRRTLVEELGVEPSARLQDLQVAVLNATGPVEEPADTALRLAGMAS